MIKRYVFGNPFDTQAILTKIESEKKELPFFNKSGNTFTYAMDKNDIIWGLGENVRGMNKRGHTYVSWCSDEFEHSEEKKSLYGAHNFFVIDGKIKLGIFVDCPGRVTFDIGESDYDTIKITIENKDYEIYTVEEKSVLAIIKEFRKIIGESYIPPKWAFGIGQSRWGYGSEKDLLKVQEGYRKNNLPVDMIYLDIDYMNNFKDFTVDPEKYSDFKATIAKLKSDKIRVIPIIDAGVKVEDGYDVYDEGIKNGYFCKDKDGKEFIVGVWPGRSVLPDFLNKDAAKWFGQKYKTLTDMGIEGFWNDMNEPALFYSEKNKQKVFEHLAEYKDTNVGLYANFAMKDAVNFMANNLEDYKSFYHNTEKGKVCHADVHNLYGYKMTESASNALEEILGKEKYLLFSRASYIGMHRGSGIWMGDNKSWWSHILLNLKMIPSLNMCGFIFTGADLGGFGSDTTEDLLLRWYALGIFLPLFRNHSCLGSREQEPYQFKSVEKFRGILNLRYRLIPYLYNTFIDSVKNNEMYGSPLGFVWQDDEDAKRCEDQLLIGDSIMIAPVYEQNATGRHVYLPEEMKLIRFKGTEIAEEKIMEKGHGYIHVALDEVCIFLRKNKKLPLAKEAASIEDVDFDDLTYIEY
ncbi:MAG: glycoside hydrolase family 31 protein [Treponema sp.]|nr:glycoside hydrolase family 31 protein [Spirochaetales bacterium]MDY5810509.1 glycoside hydrolase family 31 protein [Treponema sp.]MEE1182725.1 glycoside hydrolase family 31 protein [Treponema sp.]